MCDIFFLFQDTADRTLMRLSPLFHTAALENYDGSVTNSSLNGWLAQQNRGAAVVLEHRFFGRSNPYPNLSEASFAVHTVEQAIADIVYFAQNVKLPMPGGTKAGPDKLPWVLVGGAFCDIEPDILPLTYRLRSLSLGHRLLPRFTRCLDHVAVRHRGSVFYHCGFLMT